LPSFHPILTARRALSGYASAMKTPRVSRAEAGRLALWIGLCAASFALGRATASVELPRAPSSVAVLEPLAPEMGDRIAGLVVAPGSEHGKTPDVITPLNVRDAAALVMPPSP
jgi:hypothetical protein